MRDINLEIADALGIDTHRVVGFELRCWAGELPTVRITRHIIDEGDVDETVGAFELVPLSECFDIDRACDQAMKRLRRAIDRSASRAMRELRSSWR